MQEELQKAFDDLATEYLNKSENIQSYLFFEHRIYVIDLPNFFEKIFLTLNNTAILLIRYIDMITNNMKDGGLYIDNFESRHRLGAYGCS